MIEETVVRLESKLTELLLLLESLSQENIRLRDKEEHCRQQATQWSNQKKVLQIKLEKTLTRLQAVENEDE